MEVIQKRHGPVLRIRFAQKALLERPSWEEIPALEERGVALIALDLHEADFVSTQFLEGCLELARSLACHVRQVVLLNLSAHHSRVLALIDGGSSLPVLKDEQELARKAAALVAGSAEGQRAEGVSSVEKMILWS